MPRPDKTPRPKLTRTSAFRLTLLYTAVFCVSVLALLAFIYWSTVAVIERQTAETIEAEIRGLAEQYRERGLGRLIEVVRERSGEGGDDDNVYLLTDPLLNPLAGNLSRWPPDATAQGEWVQVTVFKSADGKTEPHMHQARTFTLRGGFRLLVGRDMSERQGFRATVIEALAWAVAVAVALGLAGGAFVSRRMLRRVDEVSGTAQRIVAGDLSQRVGLTGTGDEFDRLSESLNAMLDQIERLMTGMRLATDSIAHDLRGPLTRLKGRVELALRRPRDTDQDREALADVLAQTDAALAVFDSLIKIAMAESGVDQAELQPLDLTALARDAADLYSPAAEDQGMSLELKAGDAAWIRGQPQLLAQALANLLDNALRHSPEGGRIALRVTRDTAEVEVSVADSGPGIPEADRRRVLQRFVRLETARSGPGAGLGLSLVAAVAKLHGAELSLGDNSPGLMVSMRFPAVSPAGDGVDQTG